MTGTVPFVRSLGAESGYQLNPLVDDSELPSSSISDQSFAIAARLTRGRIDKSFSVSRNNFRQRAGIAGRMDISALNEAPIHIAEALNNGARNAVIARLVSDSAVISYINLYTAEITVLEPVITLGVITDVTIVNGGEYQADGAPLTITGDGIDADIDVVVVGGVITGVTINDGGTGYTLPLTTVSYDEPTPATDGFIFKVEAGLPVTSNFVFSIKHLGCYNDGIIVKFRAEENLLGATEIDTSKVFIDVLDNKEEALFRFYGCFDAGHLCFSKTAIG